MTTSTASKEIAGLNDKCRQYVMIPIFGTPEVPCKIMMTSGIRDLSPINQIEIAAKVRDYDDFTEDNDPYGEHDFGVFEHNGEKIFWKIDYYDLTLTWGSDAPEDTSKTIRVLAIMLASEY